MYRSAGQPAEGAAQQTIHIKVGIPELAAGDASKSSSGSTSGSFWLRDYPTHHTFGELYQDCINHPDVIRVSKILEKLPASRHFWCGDRMMRRDKPVGTAQMGGPGTANNEISLVLRRDYYRVDPTQYVKGGNQYLYVDAEAPISEVIETILISEERPCCFDLCDSKRHRLTRTKSLTDYDLVPEQEGSGKPFPAHAMLVLRPRSSWLPTALLIGTFIAGLCLSYVILSHFLNLATHVSTSGG